LADRLRKRGISVGVGDRVPYIIVKDDKKMAAYEKSEDPVYVLENNLPIDKEYYIEQQMFKPVHRLFEPMMDNVSSLFHGEHTKTISRGVTVNGPMNAFIKANEECVRCKKAGSIICNSCRSSFPSLLINIQKVYNEKSQIFNKSWVECQRCMGSMTNEALCVNRVCPIFYMRTKVKKELAPLEERLEKLRNISW
jgi:DNA polymerase delta subunit 1